MNSTARHLSAFAASIIFLGSSVFADVTINLPTMAAGKTIVIRYQATVNTPIPSDPLTISNQAIVMGDPMVSVLSDDPGTSDVAGDPTLTQITNQNPLYVELESLTADVDGASVTLNWSTSAEVNNLGFHVYRATQSDGEWSKGARLTTVLIAGEGSPSSGASYSFADPDPLAEGETSRAYILDDYDTAGRVTSHGPAIAARTLAEIGEWRSFE